MARGKRPVPFRTRKLSLSAPMVLPWRRGGRVGRRRTFFGVGPFREGWPFAFSVRRQRWGVRVEDRRSEPRGGARGGRGGPPQSDRRSDARDRDSRPRTDRPVDPELPEDVTL